ncbi:MAG: hypothetical protein COB20_05010 [SAR86 cluster bacterium]|uniref:Uncharacterized protein n=1 Tax=SAR86 cluster bacterium TaxID=2030880 RepID=A0A2A4X9M9_9GAMM|nr:MAG: hypothetical protein COB20_05010 [SAR86 cluster bacterium]
MKFKFEKPVLIKLLIIGALLIIAPYAVPFSIEFVLMADLMGLEALVLFLIYQSRHAITALVEKLVEWRTHTVTVIILLASAYIFQPKVFLSHVAGSSIILLFACSFALAFALWVPAIYLSSGGFV